MSDESRSDELKEQFNMFVKAAATGLNDLKNAVVSTAQVGRLKLDVTFLRRSRDRMLRDLGSAIVAAVASGDVILEGELQQLCEQIAEVDAKIRDEEARVDELLFRTDLDPHDDAPPPDAPEEETVVDAKVDAKPE
ncbi:MAG: hypothetical protein KC609_04095 [Myxococcales bacterium]|nr:hypothetical protein [Myxococcales bacterium]